VIEGRVDPDGQPGHISAWAEDRTSHLAFMYKTGLITVFNRIYTDKHGYFVTGEDE
jgi:hypothetical protein